MHPPGSNQVYEEMKSKIKELNEQIELRKKTFGMFACGIIDEDEA